MMGENKMSTKIYFACLVLLVIGSIMMLSCDNSTGPAETHEFPDAIDSVATDIDLYVYAYYGYEFMQSPTKIQAPILEKIPLDTVAIATEGPITLSIPNYDYYQVYAEADGFYTELYYCQKDVEFTVDLDAVPDVPNSITGVIFEENDFYSDAYYADSTIALTAAGGKSIFGKTDSQGRFGFSNLTDDNYILHFIKWDLAHYFELYNSQYTDYHDFYFYGSNNIIEAPNIYLYPETTSDISVRLDFPSGGNIVNSVPPYNNGWDVTVTPEGLIDGTYDYLFYEISTGSHLNLEDGWLLDGTNLPNEFRFLLANLGYYDNEINDFLEYWLPRLNDSPYYAVYPQTPEELIDVSIEPQPDQFLRSIFVIAPLPKAITLNEPSLPDAINRDGFTAVEWGAILLEK